jgi:hypothetical protein
MYLYENKIRETCNKLRPRSIETPNFCMRSSFRTHIIVKGKIVKKRSVREFQADVSLAGRRSTNLLEAYHFEKS